MDIIKKAAQAIIDAHHAIAFTGAGISLESGVPTFRGSKDSIWNNYDLNDIDISHFLSNPTKSWNTIKACFYNFMQERNITPNYAHYSLARLEQKNILKAIITQNIDALHQMAGSKNVIEFHGTTASATCLNCKKSIPATALDLSQPIPRCPSCNGIMKPDFVFFGEGIPEKAFSDSEKHARNADLCIVVGTTAEVMPAGMIPISIHRNGGKIIEINPNKSAITDSYVDFYIPLGAVEAFTLLDKEINTLRPDFD